MSTPNLEAMPQTPADVFPGAPKHFLAKVPTPLPPENECWVWQGYIRKESGYGEISLDDKTTMVHRAAYCWANDTMLEAIKGLDIDHVVKNGCTSRACVNPNHLEAVTHNENMHRQGDALPQTTNGNHKPGQHPNSKKNLVPDYRFTDSDKAREAGRKSGAARRARAEARAQEQALELARQQRATNVILHAAPDDTHARTIEARSQMLDRLLANEVPCRNLKEWADAWRALDESMRLDAGQPTSRSVSISANLEELRARLLDKPATPSQSGYESIASPPTSEDAGPPAAS